MYLYLLPYPKERKTAQNGLMYWLVTSWEYYGPVSQREEKVLETFNVLPRKQSGLLNGLWSNSKDAALSMPKWGCDFPQPGYRVFELFPQ
jgi:hypothetical protein